MVDDDHSAHNEGKTSSLRTPDPKVQDTMLPNGDSNAADNDEEEYVNPSSGTYTAMSQLLPHPQLATKLFSKYFDVVHPIWPILLEAETRKVFSHTWTPDHSPEPLWLVQLNLIMCLGCQHHEADGNDHMSLGFDAAGSGKDFHQRAQAYVYANAFATTSIEMLQALLLMALYQRGAMRFSELYLTTGHAIRMAQSLGFHISRPETDAILPQYRELRRRLWWSCFCLDR